MNESARFIYNRMSEYNELPPVFTLVCVYKAGVFTL